MESELFTKYEECLNKIFRWGAYRNKVPVPRSELTLDNMVHLCELVGSPQKGSYKIVHVTGTNGKGSTCLKTARALQQAGFKVGLFTSPHISSFRERIQINGQLVTIEDIVETAEYVIDVILKNDLDVRFFEIVTTLGFLLFKKYGCDYVMLECGLGALLDATNIVQYPDVVCSAIVSVGHDHMDVLGNDLEEIAREKAGIIKKDIPCVLGPSCAPLASI